MYSLFEQQIALDYKGNKEFASFSKKVWFFTESWGLKLRGVWKGRAATFLCNGFDVTAKPKNRRCCNISVTANDKNMVCCNNCLCPSCSLSKLILAVV